MIIYLNIWSIYKYYAFIIEQNNDKYAKIKYFLNI